MCLVVYVQIEERFAEAALAKGKASLTFIAHPDKDKVLVIAADVAEQFDVDLYVDGKLTDLWELRDSLA